jgi:hypothetical protein
MNLFGDNFFQSLISVIFLLLKLLTKIKSKHDAGFHFDVPMSAGWRTIESQALP